MSGVITRLSPGCREFPPGESALKKPNGLLAIGGDTEPDTLLAAYRQGIFPWYSQGEPILWWSPDPRMVLFPACVHISRSLWRRLRRGDFQVTADTAFAEVVQNCAAAGRTATWISDELRQSFERLHQRGLAHSVEVWRGEELAGGLYGLALGGCFFGESMFSKVPDASKVALVCLCRQMEAWGITLIDCQVSNPHLASMGAVEISRQEFLDRLGRHLKQPGREGPWREIQLPADCADGKIG